MPHPWKGKVRKCPTNARGGGMSALGIDGAIILQSRKRDGKKRGKSSCTTPIHKIIAKYQCSEINTALNNVPFLPPRLFQRN